MDAWTKATDKSFALENGGEGASANLFANEVGPYPVFVILDVALPARAGVGVTGRGATWGSSG